MISSKAARLLGSAYVSRLTTMALAIAILVPAKAFATEASAVELGSLFLTIENNYGPLKHKESYLSIKWPELKERYKQRALKVTDSDGFYFMAADLLNELKDAHVGITLPTDYKKSLPLQFAFVENKTILAYIEDKAATQCAAEIGDELVKLDGKSPEQIRTELGLSIGVGNKRTDQSYSTLMLTNRREERGLRVSREANQVSTLEFRSGNRTVSCRLQWSEEGAPMFSRPELAQPGTHMNTPFLGLTTSERAQQLFKRVDKLFRLKSSVLNPGLELAKNSRRGKGAAIQIGAAEPFFKLPSDFVAIEDPSDLAGLVESTGLKAGVFTRNGVKVGFLRIPSYEPKNLEMALFGLRYIVSKLQAESDLLVIDQTMNPGGAVVWSDWIVSSFVGKLDRRHMKFSIRASQDFVREFVGLVSMLERSDATSEAERAIKAEYLPMLKEDLARVQKAYVERAFLSEPIRLHLTSELSDKLTSAAYASQLSAIAGVIGVDLSEPQVYSKPVYMMINELDFSGGDATPAVLKDYGRVTLVGVNTAGAGGSVQEFTHSQDHTFKFNLTVSLMVRGNGSLVENFGVKPDIAFEPTIQDYKDGFSSYFSRLLDTIAAKDPNARRLGLNN